MEQAGELPAQDLSSAVGAESSVPAGKAAIGRPSVPMKAMPVSLVWWARTASSRPIRRMTSRPSPRTSTFWPSSRRWSKRSTTVTSPPAAASHDTAAGPAMLAPEIRMLGRSVPRRSAASQALAALGPRRLR